MKKPTTDVTSIDQYIDSFPDDVKRVLAQVRTTVKRVAPDATEKISYKMPAFYLNGGLVAFAAFTKHIGFYPGASAIKAFESELKPYQYSKGGIQFPIDEPMPLKFITKIVRFRVVENAAREPKSKRKYQ